MNHDAAGWQEFYVMAGGAAAVLTGLIFVALSLHAKAIMAHPLFRDRAFASLESLIAQLFLSAVMLVPGQGRFATGVEIEIIAAFFLVRTIRALRLMHVVDPQLRRRQRSLWLTEGIAWSLWLVVLSASGVALILGSPNGLYLLAVAMLYMFASNVWNAWVLIAEVSE